MIDLSKWRLSLCLFQAQSSPRRVAVPVLVKDGKPCSGGGGGGDVTPDQQHCAQHSPATGMGAPATSAAPTHQVTPLGSGGSGGGGGAHPHSAPPPPHHQQTHPHHHHHQQPPPAQVQHQSQANLLAYQRQAAMHHPHAGHHPAAAAAAAANMCSAYLPLQGRAW